MDTTCLEHYTEEGDIRIFGQATSSREEGHVEDEKKGDKTGGKNMKKGKSVAPDKSFAANRTRGGHRGPGRGQKWLLDLYFYDFMSDIVIRKISTMTRIVSLEIILD